ncbi:MAG: OmpA family protein [Alphaproteobacteria bacterium]|nr:OmpA family protein [Alphaproteobacteria bacterium]MBL7098376.1 OmpA family protein [Alphaproteobacteria bacterium]
MTKSVMRLAAVLVFALGTSACSTVDSAISDVVGDDTPSSSAPTDANGFPVDTAPPPVATSDAAAPTTPDLASVPPKPSGVTTPDAQREAADSLAADRARNGYSAEALRGGTEAAAPPPGPPEPEAVAANAPPPSTTPSAPPSQPETSARPPSTDSTVPGPGAPPPADNTPPAAAPASPPVTSASMAPPPGAQPAVPAVPGVPGAMPTVVADANLGFKPSTAPALDPSVSQFVAAPIIARYQQTAANAGAATGPMQPSVGSDPAVAAAGRPGGHTRAMGGPEAMSGSVIANFDALNQTTPSVYANASGLPPAAVVMFPNDGVVLDTAARAQVRAAVTAFQQRGGTGFVKVVGHSSSRTGNMPVEKHLIAIFQKSQARANAVAKELIREGVPASRVLVEAVGDSQPVYYESMPQGEAGNRRAEIFLQS